MKKFFVSTLVVLVICTACVSQHPIDASQQALNASALIANPSIYDRVELAVVGTLHRDESGHGYIMGGDNVDEQMSKGRFLDLVVYNKQIREMLSKQVDGCIQISGKFLMYSKNILPTGSLISPIGEIQAASAMPCQVH